MHSLLSAGAGMRNRLIPPIKSQAHKLISELKYIDQVPSVVCLVIIKL